MNTGTSCTHSSGVGLCDDSATADMTPAMALPLLLTTYYDDTGDDAVSLWILRRGTRTV